MKKISLSSCCVMLNVLKFGRHKALVRLTIHISNHTNKVGPNNCFLFYNKYTERTQRRWTIDLTHSQREPTKPVLQQLPIGIEFRITKGMWLSRSKLFRDVFSRLLTLSIKNVSGEIRSINKHTFNTTWKR